MKRSATRFVVVAPQGLGDTLEATPFLAALRQARPSAFVTAIVLRRPALELLEQTELVDEIIYLPYWERGAAAFIAGAARLPSVRRADAAFLMYPAARPLYLGLFALVRAKKRYAHRYDESWLRTIAGLWIEQIPIVRHHNVYRNADLLTAAGIAAELPDRYVVPGSWITGGPREARRVVMHVGTIAHDGLEARRWPESSFADLGRRLRGRGFDVALLAGPSEMEATARVAAAVPESTTVCLPLADAAAFLSTSRAVVANDNGIAHVAAGCRTPVLALFGPTPVEHGPFGASSVSFRPSPCPACFDVVKTDTRCKLDIDYACLKRDLSVDDVEQRLLELIEATSAEEDGR